MLISRRAIVNYLIVALLLLAVTPSLLAQDYVSVPVVLFTHRSCHNCTLIEEEILPPLQEKYGDRLALFVIELKPVNDAETARLLGRVGAWYNVPEKHIGTPTILIGEHILIGPTQIRQSLDLLINYYLQNGVVPFPPVPGLADRIPFSVKDVAVEVLFVYPPNCPTCPELAETVFEPLKARFGTAFHLRYISSLHPEVAALAATNQLAPPFAFVGEVPLTKEELASKLPALVWDGLRQDGAYWPDWLRELAEDGATDWVE